MSDPRDETDLRRAAMLKTAFGPVIGAVAGLIWSLVRPPTQEPVPGSSEIKR